jgi:hypothetical protein
VIILVPSARSGPCFAFSDEYLDGSIRYASRSARHLHVRVCRTRFGRALKLGDNASLSAP